MVVQLLPVLFVSTSLNSVSSGARRTSWEEGRHHNDRESGWHPGGRQDGWGCKSSFFKLFSVYSLNMLLELVSFHSREKEKSFFSCPAKWSPKPLYFLGFDLNKKVPQSFCLKRGWGSQMSESKKMKFCIRQNFLANISEGFIILWLCTNDPFC